MMFPKLFLSHYIPRSRAIYMLCKALNLKVRIQEVDVLDKDHVTPELLKVNPRHTVPTLNDNGFVISESHAISVYLVNKYAGDDSLYPQDPQKQALVNQRLHFDAGYLYPFVHKLFKPIMWQGAKKLHPRRISDINRAYSYLEKFLIGKFWAAGNDVTLADLHLLTSVTSAALVVPVEPAKFPNVVAWLEKTKSLPYYDANEASLEVFEIMVKGFLRC